MQNDVSKVLKHTAVYLLARGVPGIVSFLAIPLFTRLLTPWAYGKYALVIAAVTLINCLSFQWLRLALVRYLPVYRDNPIRLKSTLLTVEILLIAATAVIAAAVYFLPIAPSWHDVVWPCWLLLVVQAMFDLSCEHTRASIRPGRYMLLQVARVSIWVAVGCVLAWITGAWWAPVAGMAVGLIIPVIYAYWHDWTDARLNIDRATFVAIARYGIPLSATSALAVVVGSSDRFLIASLMNQSAAGVYAVAADLAGQTVTLLMVVISLAIFPLAVRAFELDGPAAAREQMRYNGSLMLAVGLPAAAAFALLAGNLAHCCLGESYRAAATGIIPLVALGALLAGFKAYHLDAAFQFAHRTIDQVWIVAVVAVVNLVLNFLAIPRYGVMGAATASVLAYVVSIVITAWYGRRYFVLPIPTRSLIQILAACAVMTLVLLPLRDSRGAAALTAQVLCGGAAYAATLLAANFLDIRRMFLAQLAPRRSASSAAVAALVAEASQRA